MTSFNLRHVSKQGPKSEISRSEKMCMRSSVERSRRDGIPVLRPIEASIMFRRASYTANRGYFYAGSESIQTAVRRKPPLSTDLCLFHHADPGPLRHNRQRHSQLRADMVHSRLQIDKRRVWHTGAPLPDKEGFISESSRPSCVGILSIEYIEGVWGMLDGSHVHK